jgi:O-antigen ligase
VLRKVIEFGLIGAIFIAVGGFGGTSPIPRAVFESLILLLGVLLASNPSKFPGEDWKKLLWFPAALCAWVMIQWLGSRSGKIGVDVYAIEAQGLVLATCFTAFFLAAEVARERADRDRLAFSLIGLGVFEAIYGLAEYLAGWQYIWNVPRRYYLGSATGTYINHNHFAGLLEIVLPLALGLAFYHWQKARDRMRRRSMRDFFCALGAPEMLKCYLLLLIATLISLALVFSFSRMGLISMIASLGFMVAVIWTGRNRGALSPTFILFLIVSSVAATAWVGVEPVVKHFEELSRDDSLVNGSEGRLALWQDTIKLIRTHPWTGSGVGTFAIAFTPVQSHELNYSVDHAHNDYLEFAAEFGIPAAAFLLLGFFAVAARTLRASRLARSSRTRSLALGTLTGISALLVHGIADFNLHIPANDLVFSVLLGMGYAMSMELPPAAKELNPSSGVSREFRLRDLRAHYTEAAGTEHNEEMAGIKGSRSD